MPQALGQYFVEWRRHASLTQEQVADAIGHTKGYVSELERGIKRYNQDILENLARIFGCSPSDLLSRAPDGKDASEVVDIWTRIEDQKERTAWMNMGKALGTDE